MGLTVGMDASPVFSGKALRSVEPLVLKINHVYHSSY